MAKKIIPLLLVFCLIISGISGVYATDYMPPDDASAASADVDIPNTSSDLLTEKQEQSNNGSTRSSSIISSLDEILSEAADDEKNPAFRQQRKYR